MSHARPVAVVLTIAAGSFSAACAGRRVPQPVAPRPALIVLLPDPETATTGRARVTNEYGSVDLAAPRHATVVTADSGPAPVRTIDEAEVARVFETALAALPPMPRHFTLRFLFESDELTEESRALVPQILGAVKAMPFPEVAIIGHTDTLGDARANVALGLKRAVTVRGFLEMAGFDASTIDIRSHGEADLLIKTPNNTPEPRNRRVEIVVR
jgi:outer membrane protein OmpA-like peptidoglycan-associated protein